MTLAIVAANVLVFLWELSLPPRALERLFYVAGIVPGRLTGGAPAAVVPGLGCTSLVSSMFLHGGLLHIASNLWILWIFGDNVEDRLGPWRYVAFYFVAGIAAGALHVVTNAGSTLPTIGASGAIAGVLGAYARFYPRARVLTIVPIFFYPLFLYIPALVFLGLWFFSQLFSGALALAGPQSAGGVAWWAHVGGFLFGVIVAPLLERSRPPAPPEPRHWLLSDPRADRTWPRL